MQAIDIHAHFAPVARFEEMRAIAPDHVPVVAYEGENVYFRYPNGVENGPVPRAIVDIEQRLVEMAETHVTHHVLSARPQMFNYELPGNIASSLAFWSNDALVDAGELFMFTRAPYGGKGMPAKQYFVRHAEGLAWSLAKVTAPPPTSTSDKSTKLAGSMAVKSPCSAPNAPMEPLPACNSAFKRVSHAPPSFD